MQDLFDALKNRVEGDVMFDSFSRGRYATDASLYQMMPIGVMSPKSEDDISAALDIAAEQGVPLLARGGGTSQCGQTVNTALFWITRSISMIFWSWMSKACAVSSDRHSAGRPEPRAQPPWGCGFPWMSRPLRARRLAV